LLYKNFLQGHHGAIYLLVGVRGHQGITHEGVLRGTGGRNDWIDEHACLEGEGGHEESLLHVAHIEGDDGALGVANLEALLTETLQGVVGDIPQGLDALWLALDDVQGGHGGSSGCGRI